MSFAFTKKIIYADILHLIDTTYFKEYRNCFQRTINNITIKRSQGVVLCSVGFD